ncbi:MAG TPA: alpha-glucan family phosphorylase [Acidobacteriota bacterium]|nr:alpha-glucan family phosphorylase [Acidobacteriota bacterium]
MEKHDRKIAYFSMEIGFDSAIPTYSGGLGILSGDTLKSCADLSVPIVGITLLNRYGYFKQTIDAYGNQHEEPYKWPIESLFKKTGVTITVTIEDRDVKVTAWEYILQGERGATVPIYFLDTKIEGNSEYDSTLTDVLYAGDRQYRFCQEMILGLGGVRMLDALGYFGIDKFHMNEGHAALCTIELLHRYKFDIEHVKERCVFTTHTPVEAGHDTFDIWMVGRMIKDYYPWSMKLAEHNGIFNMTYLALNLSNYVNGVAKKHKEVSMHMFPGREIHAITNGVHAPTWVGPHMAAIFDKYIPDWRHDPFSLRSALAIPDTEIWAAHQEAKADLLSFVNTKYHTDFDVNVLTLGFARRSTGYKRPDLLFTDVERLKSIAAKFGKLQIIYAGKAHVSDGQGKDIIRRIWNLQNNLGPNIKLIFVEDYDMNKGRMLTSGVDVWLNTPTRPLEASGTSGMKAALNGVMQFSTLDGWWIEGYIEGKTGWTIGPLRSDNSDDMSEDSSDLYNKLEKNIVPTYYREPWHWNSMMRHAIAMNGSYFNTHRMVQQYVTNAYLR